VDPEVRALVDEITDPDRARASFERSESIRRLWPPALAGKTLPFFGTQRILNRLMREGANPLRDINDIHALLTGTSLRRLPLWALGSDDVLQEIAETGNDGSGLVEYQIGIRALVARSYKTAADMFSESERRGLRVTTLRPLLAYALWMAGRVDDARRLTPMPIPAAGDEGHFWRWLQDQFGT